QATTWTYQGADMVPGLTNIYTNTATITGTAYVKGGVLTTVLSQSNPFNNGNSLDSNYTKDLHGITFHGDNDRTDRITPQLVPYMTNRFPFGEGSALEQINKKGLDFGEDLDGDGKNEKVDILSIVTILGFESVSVPKGTFPNSARVETKTKITAIASSDG